VGQTWGAKDKAPASEYGAGGSLVKVLIRSTFALMKIGILAAAVVAASFGLAQKPSAEGASETQIIFSYSDAAPVPAPQIIVTPGSVARDVYIWATDVKDPTGVSGFSIAVQFDESLLSVTPASGDNDGIGDKTWLQSTNRPSACASDQIPQAGEVFGGCSTLTRPPPLGATGSGIIGHLVLTSGSEMALSSPLMLVPSNTGVRGTQLLDTPVDLEVRPIPLTLVSSNVVVVGCADNSPPPSGDGAVDLPNDILGVVLRFQMTSADPNWSPLFDINSDGLIDLPNDILGTILQFNLPCTHP
jgi:hypothetical protein